MVCRPLICFKDLARVSRLTASVDLRVECACEQALQAQGPQQAGSEGLTVVSATRPQPSVHSLLA